MSGEAIIAVFYYGAGLLFWPVFQLFHRRRSPCAKRFAIVFLLTLGLLIGHAAFLALMWREQDWLPLVLLFPLLNLISLLASAAICIASPKNYAR